MATETQIVERAETVPVAPEAPADPITQLLLAAQSGADAGALEKVADVVLRMREADATAAWSDAFSRAQAALVPVLKDREGHNAKYATFQKVVAAVRPVCAEYGLSFTFTTEGRGENMVVVCRLRHRLGHVEETRFPCYIDKAMRANDSQKVASASSYAKRYALEMALGSSNVDELDDDGESLVESISDEQAADLEALCSEVGADRERFLSWLGIEDFADLPAAQHGKAVKGLEAKRRQGQ